MAMIRRNIYRLCAVFGAALLPASAAATLQTQSISQDPVTSSRSVSATQSPLIVKPFPLGQVRLLEGPFKAAMERNAKYLLELDPDRFLHNTRKYAELEPKGELYG